MGTKQAQNNTEEIILWKKQCVATIFNYAVYSPDYVYFVIVWIKNNNKNHNTNTKIPNQSQTFVKNKKNKFHKSRKYAKERRKTGLTSRGNELIYGFTVFINKPHDTIYLIGKYSIEYWILFLFLFFETKNLKIYFTEWLSLARLHT